MKNIIALKEKNIKIAIGHTFNSKGFIYEAQQIIRFIKKYNDYIADNIDNWDKIGIKAYFDCPVPFCYMKSDTYNKLRKYNAISQACLPKAIVKWDLTITHCYYTMGLDPSPPKLSDFSSIDEIKLYSEKLLNMVITGKEKCDNCTRKTQDVICGCYKYTI